MILILQEKCKDYHSEVEKRSIVMFLKMVYILFTILKFKKENNSILAFDRKE